MNARERIHGFWNKLFPKPKPLAEEKRMELERIASLEVSPDGDVHIKDLARYFGNCPHLREDLEALKKIPLGAPLGDDLRPIHKNKN